MASLVGFTVALSGTLSRPRKEVQTLIESQGGTYACTKIFLMLTASVNNSVTHLVVANPKKLTGKLEAAKNKGIKIVGEVGTL